MPLVGVDLFELVMLIIKSVAHPFLNTATGRAQAPKFLCSTCCYLLPCALLVMVESRASIVHLTLNIPTGRAQALKFLC